MVRRRAETGGRSAHGQRGSTLVESLVALAITSVALMGIFAGYFTTVSVSGMASRAAADEEALQTLTARIEAIPYRNCASLAQMNADLAAAPPVAGYVVSVEKIDYLSAASGTFVSNCAADGGAQRVGIRAVGTGGGNPVARAQIVIRNPTARPA